MPRTRLDPQPHPLSRLIWGAIKASGRTLEDACTQYMCGSTLCRRLKNPETFTVGELKALSKSLHIPADDIRACMKF